jgi:hypothetical protein
MLKNCYFITLFLNTYKMNLVSMQNFVKYHTCARGTCGYASCYEDTVHVWCYRSIHLQSSADGHIQVLTPRPVTCLNNLKIRCILLPTLLIDCFLSHFMMLLLLL